MGWPAWVTKIPICGGYVAETKNPEETCLVRFSNEETVPQPCLRKRCCRSFFEHNAVMRNFGRVGFPVCERNRKPIMLLAFFFSFLGWFFTIAAMCAYTAENDATINVGWGHADVDGGSLEYFVGLTRVVFRSKNGKVMAGFNWDEFSGVCGETVSWISDKYKGVKVTGMPLVSCEDCRDVSNECIRLAVMSCITQVFQITTDLQRTTRYGDLNCQKMFGCFTSFWGLYSTWTALVVFRTDCGMRSHLPPWHKTTEMAVTLADGSAGFVPVDVGAGWGYVLIFIAVWLKLYDALAHLCVPTPPANHLPPPHHEAGGPDPYEVLADYMLLSTDQAASATRTKESQVADGVELQTHQPKLAPLEPSSVGTATDP